MHKIRQSRGLLVRLLGPLTKPWLRLIGNVSKPLAISLLTPLGLTSAESATDVAIHKKIFGYGVAKLIISNEEMNDIMKIAKSLE